MTLTLTPWKVTVATKRQQIANQIPAAWRISDKFLVNVNESSSLDVREFPSSCGILNDREIDITEQYDATELVQKIVAKNFSSLEVALAFCKRAAIAGQLTNCLTEIFFDQAIERAKFLDAYLDQEGKPFGPFHGLPISLKDTFNIKGVQSTIGYVSFIKHGRAEANAPLADLLLSQGAVLYVKTNIPQTLMAADSVNNVFGRVLNPYNLSLTAGGSSGGEAALIAMGGSILGVGTDVAGSIRIPALCCGVFGFRPTTYRVPSGGQASPGKATLFGIQAVAGPLARSVGDLQFFMESVLQAEPWRLDMSAHRIPWNPAPLKANLRIGLIQECPTWPISHQVKQVLKSAATRLTHEGHTVLTLKDFPSFSDALELCWRYFDLDNGRTSFQHITASGEPLIKAVSELPLSQAENRQLQTLEGLFELDVKRTEIMSRWHSIFKDNELDILIMPGSQHGPAVPHDVYGEPPYTAMWNLVDYPACIIPLADKCNPYSFAGNGADGNTRHFKDPPHHIQIVAPSYHDEQLISAAAIIDKVLRRRA